jgi:uncharacterized membrane protein
VINLSKPETPKGSKKMSPSIVFSYLQAGFLFLCRLLIYKRTLLKADLVTPSETQKTRKERLWEGINWNHMFVSATLVFKSCVAAS